MATLADVIRKRRQSGQGVGKSLAGGLKEKLKEKVDLRRFLDQNGVITALFPKLKAFKASGSRSVGSELQKRSAELTSSSSSMSSVTLNRIQADAKITAKNSMVLPALARDMNIMRQNIAKLLKEFGVKPTYRADSFFKRSGEREIEYESKVKETATQITGGVEKKTKDESGGSLLETIGKILLFAKSLGTLFTTTIGKFGRVLVNVLGTTLKPITTILKTALSGIMSLIVPFIGKIFRSVLSIFTFTNLSKIVGRFLLGVAGTGIIASALATVAATYGLNELSNAIKQKSLDKFTADPMQAATSAIENEEAVGKTLSNLTGNGTAEVEQNYVASELQKADPKLTAGQAINRAKEILNDGASLTDEYGQVTPGAVSGTPLSQLENKIKNDAKMLATTGKLPAQIVQKPDQDGGVTQGLEPTISKAIPMDQDGGVTQGLMIQSQSQENKQNIENIGEDVNSETVIAPLQQENNSSIETSSGKIPSAVNDDIVYYFGGGGNSVYA